jgi:hypothetical protein
MKIAIFASRGDAESLHALANFCCSCAVMRHEVHCLLSGVALRAVVCDTVDSAPASTAGGGEFVERRERSQGVSARPSSLLKDIRALGGLTLYACSGSVGIWSAGGDGRIDEQMVLSKVDRIVGYPEFLEIAAGCDRWVAF